ncbi:hypothetical protein ARMSODRAFT_614086 [Armillaria solidipes]|uniref:Uncharacterized protein n=1 Tax=Armillaria solidipes TaxID=1076256 RepID=A0A2H3B7L2_9AGAR|nr:hypothetical protein ARMSODRAFT_614086 [Armillaria solidipes]
MTTRYRPRHFPPPLPPTPIRNQDAFMHTATTLFPNLTNLHGSPYLIILAPFRPLINLLIAISILIYAGFRPTTILEYLPPSLYCLRFMFKIRSLPFPSSDLHVLRRHSAFGIHNIEFSDAPLCRQAEVLLDGNDDSPSSTPLPPTPMPTLLLSTPSTSS